MQCGVYISADRQARGGVSPVSGGPRGASSHPCDMWPVHPCALTPLSTCPPPRTCPPGRPRVPGDSQTVSGGAPLRWGGRAGRGVTRASPATPGPGLKLRGAGRRQDVSRQRGLLGRGAGFRRQHPDSPAQATPPRCPHWDLVASGRAWGPRPTSRSHERFSRARPRRAASGPSAPRLGPHRCLRPRETWPLKASDAPSSTSPWAPPLRSAAHLPPGEQVEVTLS